MTDEQTARGGTNEGPTPAEIVMGGLCGCDAVITHLVAGPMDFEYGDIERRCPVSNLIRDAGVDLYIDVDRRADIACAFSRKRNGPALGRPFFVSVENALSA